MTDLLSLKLSLDVFISNQSLSGGGFRGSEYPAMVQIRYRDVDGNEQLWVRGFYYHNRDNYPTLNGEQVLQEKWYPFERAILGPGWHQPHGRSTSSRCRSARRAGISTAWCGP